MVQAKKKRCKRRKRKQEKEEEAEKKKKLKTEDDRMDQKNENEWKTAHKADSSTASSCQHSHFTDTLHISHWTINSPVSCACVSPKEIEFVT